MAEVQTIEDALALIRQCTVRLDAERCPLAQARGRVLAEAVLAPEDQPAFDRSAVDGYAIRLDDAGETFLVVDQIRAGQWKPRSLELGQAVQISTGAALPATGLQVVMKEQVHAEGGRIVLKHRDHWRAIRFRGEDAKAGQRLAEPGLLLGPGALALLASVGYAQPLVMRRLRVLHATSGDELVPPSQTPPPGQIRDSNSTLVRAFIESWPADCHQIHLPEDEAAGMAALNNESLDRVDLLLISGGASVGEHDYTLRLLERLGFEIRFRKTNARPGKPLIFATRGNQLAFGLPGNPLAHFVCLNLHVRAALETLLGIATPFSKNSAQLLNAEDGEGNERETLWPARVTHSPSGAAIELLPWTSSGDLTPLASANAIARIPANTDPLINGSVLDYYSTQIQL